MSNKKRICLVTNWYPTEENPFAGSFFREQAMAMSDSFEFVVVHYTEIHRGLNPVRWVKALGQKEVTIEKIKQEYNIVEYAIRTQLPLRVVLINKLHELWYRTRHGQAGEKADSALYRQEKQKILHRAFEEYLQEPFDVLYCVSAQTESALLSQIAEVTDKPYVVAEHAPFPWPGAVISGDAKKAIEKANNFLAISYDKIRQVLLQNVQPKRFAYVGNMVDEEQFVLGNGSGGDKTFVIVAAHSFYKNYPLFIETFNRLTQITDVPFRVMVVGYNANKGYSQNAEELERKLKSSSFADKIELIPAVSRTEMPEVYARADAFVMTSVQEGMPVSALEAACCGLPIFSTMCGGVEDYVDDSVGRLFKIIDSETFAQSLKDYLEGNISFDRAHIRRQIVGQFGKKAFADNMAAIFNEVVDNYQQKMQ